jgi:hypothetical protein
MIRQSPAVCDGVGDQQDDDFDLAVAALECDPTLQCLQIVQPHLGLDADDNLREAALSIPRPQVTRDWKGHFRPPGRFGMDSVAQSPQEACMSGISDRIGVRIWAGGELEAYRGTGDGELSDRDTRELPSLDSTERRLAHANRVRRSANADASATARQANVSAGAPCNSHRLLATSIEAPLTSTHQPILTVHAYSSLN